MSKKNKQKKVDNKPQENENIDTKNEKIDTENNNVDTKNEKINTENKKDKSEKSLTKTKNKEKKKMKFTEKFKKRWFVNGSKTFLLVLIIIGVFVGVTVFLQKKDITPIDVTENKVFTLTNESKDQVKNINKDVNIYFIGYSDDDSKLDLAKQYNKANSKINVETVTSESRPDIIQKYGIDTSSVTTAIIVECGDKFKILSSSDLTTYDTSTYESIDITEEKLTAAIKTVTTDVVPKIYFLSGYNSDYTLSKTLQTLGAYIQNDGDEINTVDALSTQKIPDDCNVLVITTPSSDFDETTTNAVLEYINKGGNILWLNAAKGVETDLPNVNKVLATYGVKPFEVGYIRESDTSKTIGTPELIIPNIQNEKATQKVYGTAGIIMLDATKINMVSAEELTNLNVTETDLVNSSSKSYFRTDFKNTSNSQSDGEELNSYTIAAELDKKISEKNEETGAEAVNSKLIIFGENLFVSDITITNSNVPLIQYRQNKDIVLNSIAYLADKEEDIAVRKSTGETTYTPSTKESQFVLWIITVIPMVIILIGIYVTIIRKRKK